MPDFRINIGNGKVIVSTYSASQFVAEQTMHDIIEAITAGEIFVEKKTEAWERLPT
jgi:hypothetical protein